jgi:cell division protein FtsB
MKRILQSPILTLIFLVLCGTIGFSILTMMPTVQQNNQKITNLSGQIDRTEQIRNERETKSQYLKSDDYLEREARIKLNYKKQGEEVVFVYKKPYTSPTISASSSSTDFTPGIPASASYVEQWLHYLWGTY